MKKRLFLTMMLLSSFLGGSVLTINAAAGLKAIWCRTAPTPTLYILYDDNESYSAGGTYDGKTITAVYTDLGSLYNKGESGYTIGSTCKKVVIDESFQNSERTYNSFMNLEKLTSITGLQYMITGYTTSMNNMFSNCKVLTSIDLTGVNTSNVTDMTSAFYNCQNLQSIIGLSDINTSNVQFMDGLFNSCNNLQSLDLSGFDTGKVTSMKRMFYNCKILQSLDLSSFNTGNVATEGMKEMFYGCEKLQTLELSSNFTTSKVTTMEKMFCNCQVLQSLDLSSFTTATVTSMKSMFQYCKALVSLDLSSFDTGEVKDDGMQEMFSSCLALQSLNLGSHFNTSKVTTMKSMFSNCNSLASLDVSSFNTSLVTDMSYMFDHCYLLPSLDLRNFDVSKVTNMSYMFCSNTGLVRIYSNTDWNQNTPTSTDMFVSCNNLEGAIKFTSGYHNATHANPTNGYFTYRYPVTLSFSDNSKTATVGTAFTEPTLTISTTDPSNPELSVTYSSSNEVVATVDATTGKVIPLSSGTINIIATYEGTIHYEPQSASYELTVNAKSFGSKTALCGVGLTSDHIYVPGKLETDLGDNLISGSVALTANEDYSVLTLTLTDAKFSTTTADKTIVPNFIYNQWRMNIILVGDNEVSSTKSSAIYNHYGPMTVSGTGKLTISGNSGIYNNGSFIQNGGTLNVTGRQFGLYGSNDNIKFTINDGVLIVTGGSDASISCKQATGQLILGTGVTITQPYGAQWNSDKYAVVDAEGNPIKSKVTIAKGAAACGLAYSKSSETVVYGSTTALPTLTNPHSLPVTYSSSNTAVATVAADGKVTLVGFGTATITAMFDGNATYQSGIASYDLNYTTKTVTSPTIALSETSYTYDGTAKTPTVTVNDGETVIPVSEYTVGYSNNTNAGTATVTITDVEGGNYIVSGSKTFNIGKKTVTVTAKDATKAKGTDDPVFTYDVVGLVGSDKLTGALSRQAGENIGEYAITQGTLKASDNYTLNFVGAKLTIYLKGDANGDNKVNVADIVQMVKAGKSQTEINEVVDIIMSE